VPGEAAFADGRGRHSMRLNFSSEADDDIREGVRRIGKIVAEQVALYETLTGRPASRPPRHAPGGARPRAADADALGKLLELPRRGATEDRRSREA
jgi:2-aminoadipate transaminase